MTVCGELTEDETSQLLHDVPKVYNTQINDILLCALAMAIFKWSGESETLISLEGHGREDISELVDISRTIGWFTTMFPFSLRLYDKGDIGNSIKSIKEDIRKIPCNGIGYGLLKYSAGESKINKTNEPQIVFNYLGQINDRIESDAEWRLSNKALMLSQPGDSVRSFQIEINSMIIKNKLGVELNYNGLRFKHETMQNFLNDYIGSLREIINHCMTKEGKDFTPSDFSASGLNQQDLDNLIANLN